MTDARGATEAVADVHHDAIVAFVGDCHRKDPALYSASLSKWRLRSSDIVVSLEWILTDIEIVRKPVPVLMVGRRQT